MISDGHSSPNEERLLLFVVVLGMLALFGVPAMSAIFLIVGAVLSITWMIVVGAIALGVWFWVWFI